MFVILCLILDKLLQKTQFQTKNSSRPDVTCVHDKLRLIHHLLSQ